MDITLLLEIFSNPETIGTLDKSDLLTGIGFTIIMGMSVTAIILIILMAFTILLGKIFGVESPSLAVASAIPGGNVSDEEVVVITSAVAAMLNTTSDKVVIRNIKETGR